VSGRSASGPQRSRQRRRIYFPEAKKYIDTAVLDRYALKPGARVAGPAVIEERESTVVIGPAGKAKVDRDLNLIIELPSR
jgi:N-methylhydantoinase A